MRRNVGKKVFNTIGVKSLFILRVRWIVGSVPVLKLINILMDDKSELYN